MRPVLDILQQPRGLEVCIAAAEHLHRVARHRSTESIREMRIIFREDKRAQLESNVEALRRVMADPRSRRYLRQVLEGLSIRCR